MEEASVIDETNPKDLIGAKKPQLHLFPPAALVIGAKVMELGAAKYGPMNWRTKKVRLTVYVSAAMRHLLSSLDGEEVDPESGQSHVAHAMACCAILLDAAATGNLLDDRPTPGAAGRLIVELTENTQTGGTAVCRFIGCSHEGKPYPLGSAGCPGTLSGGITP